MCCRINPYFGNVYFTSEVSMLCLGSSVTYISPSVQPFLTFQNSSQWAEDLTVQVLSCWLETLMTVFFILKLTLLNTGSWHTMGGAWFHSEEHDKLQNQWTIILCSLPCAHGWVCEIVCRGSCRTSHTVCMEHLPRHSDLSLQVGMCRLSYFLEPRFPQYLRQAPLLSKTSATPTGLAPVPLWFHQSDHRPKPFDIIR